MDTSRHDFLQLNHTAKLGSDMLLGSLVRNINGCGFPIIIRRNNIKTIDP